MDERDAKAITLSRIMEEIKVAKWGTPKKKKKKRLNGRKIHSININCFC
jgi:hypothetical protein